MIHLTRTDSGNKDFQNLVIELDKDLRIRDGKDHSFYAQFNKIDSIKHVVVIYQDGQAIGCGAIKPYNGESMEIKRMFVHIAMRGKNIGSLILAELENWSKELGYDKCILETGKKQPEAIRLYKKNNYINIPNYGQYANISDSVCFEKTIQAQQMQSRPD